FCLGPLTGRGAGKFPYRHPDRAHRFPEVAEGHPDSLYRTRWEFTQAEQAIVQVIRVRLLVQEFEIELAFGVSQRTDARPRSVVPIKDDGLPRDPPVHGYGR